MGSGTDSRDGSRGGLETTGEWIATPDISGISENSLRDLNISSEGGDVIAKRQHAWDRVQKRLADSDQRSDDLIAALSSCGGSSRRTTPLPSPSHKSTPRHVITSPTFIISENNRTAFKKSSDGKEKESEFCSVSSQSRVSLADKVEEWKRFAKKIHGDDNPQETVNVAGRRSVQDPRSAPQRSRSAVVKKSSSMLPHPFSSARFPDTAREFLCTEYEGASNRIQKVEHVLKNIFVRRKFAKEHDRCLDVARNGWEPLPTRGRVGATPVIAADKMDRNMRKRQRYQRQAKRLEEIRKAELENLEYTRVKIVKKNQVAEDVSNNRQVWKSIVHSAAQSCSGHRDDLQTASYFHLANGEALSRSIMTNKLILSEPRLPVAYQYYVG